MRQICRVVLVRCAGIQRSEAFPILPEEKWSFPSCVNTLCTLLNLLSTPLTFCDLCVGPLLTKGMKSHEDKEIAVTGRCVVVC